MHVTYEFRKRLGYFEIDDYRTSRSSERILSCINHRIDQLKKEQEIIRHICAKLTIFLRTSSINPTNDNVIEYINLFIREEKQKRSAGDDNDQVIQGLENIIKEYQNEIQLFQTHVDNETDRSDIPTIEEIFVFKCQLCELPITGRYVTQQIESLILNQINMIDQREEYIQLPNVAQFSVNMQQLRQVVN
jgi:hypothetical protein